MSDNWDVYISSVDNKPAVILADLGIAQEAPKEGYSCRLTVCVHLQDPCDDGMPTKQEADRLLQIEDVLVPHLAGKGALLVGRVTSDGKRHFFFYARSERGLETAVHEGMASSAYEYDVSTDPDPGWECYFGLLYPTPADWQIIMNRKVLETLQKNGDDLSQPRRIHHWLYFDNSADRDCFVAEVRAMGFAVCIPEQSAKGDRSYGVHIHRVDSVSSPGIDNLCCELVALAQKHRGEYDGWESQVVKAGQRPIDDAPPEPS